MDIEQQAKVLDEISNHLRSMNDRAIYAAIVNEDTPEKAREKLRGVVEENDKLADRLNQAAEIMRGNDEW